MLEGFGSLYFGGSHNDQIAEARVGRASRNANRGRELVGLRIRKGRTRETTPP
jgi:hypothetical protein